MPTTLIADFVRMSKLGALMNWRTDQPFWGSAKPSSASNLYRSAISRAHDSESQD